MMPRQIGTTHKSEQKTKLSGKKRLALISEVFEAARNKYDSFETSEIGADLAYLFSAIASNGFCEWSEDRPLLKRVVQFFGQKHIVWKFIQVVEENVESDSPASIK